MAQYATTTEGDLYLANRLYTFAWDEATESQRNKALADMTLRIDRLRFRGTKTDATQALAFPRDGIPGVEDGTTPDEIKNATIEGALSLLDGRDPELDYRNLSVVAAGISGARSTYNRSSIPEYIAAGIPSMLAWEYLRPFLSRRRDVTLRRVS